MKNIMVVYKNKGETPLDAIKKLKKAHNELSSIPMTYAGRLDPLAEGVLLVLTGDEVHKKDEYLKLNKEYEVDILFGFATDTYDLMGKIIKNIAKPELLFKRSSDEGDGSRCQTILNNNSGFALEIQKILPKFTGKIKQQYPPYSSRPVKGKPLFVWAREGKLKEIEIPKHKVLIENIEILNQSEINGVELLNKVIEYIGLVSGDFRQKEIISLWKEKLIDKQNEKFPILKIKVSCGSGTYMRSLAHEIGEEIGIPAIALNIKRTKVGEYNIN